MPNDIELKYSPLDQLKPTSEFGKRENPYVSGDLRDHLGMDFRAAVGTELYNAHPGKVIFVGEVSGFGKVVVLRDSNGGPSTLYAHLDEIYVAKNNFLLGQALIGKTGKSGTKQPHLHFEIINSEVSDDIERGILTKGAGGRINPRPLIVAAFQDKITSEVLTGSYGHDIEGDSRSNTLIANSRPNILSGGAGNDVYYLPSLSDSDTIIDSDNSGIIKIAGTTLQGNALPKTDLQGNPIAGQWNLNGYDLIKSGDDLVIIPAGADVSSVDTPRVTINNFPFSQTKAFGISLGKAGFNEYNPEQIVPVDSLRGGGIFPTLDVRGRFTGIITSGQSSAVATFDGSGAIVGEPQKIVPDEYGSVFVPAAFTFLESDGSMQILLPFRANNPTEKTTTVGLARLDGNSGKIAALRIFAHETHPMVVNYGRGGISEWANKFFFDYTIVDSSISSPPQEHFLHKIDPITLQDNGPLNSYSGDRGFLSGFLADYPAITLQSGEKVELRGYKTFAIRTPKIRDMTPEEIAPNYSVAPGQEAITNGNYNRAIVTLQKAVDNSVGAALRITPAPNARLVINGLVARPDDAAIDLVDFPTISPDYLRTNTHLVASDRYSLQDLLDGKFTPPTTQNSRGVVARFFDWMSGKTQDEKQQPASASRAIAREVPAAEEDDYYEDPVQSSNSTNFNVDNPEIFSVVVLPNNQQLIITGNAAQNLTNNLGDYFIGVEGIEDSRSNITNPVSGNYTLPSNSTLPPLPNNSTMQLPSNSTLTNNSTLAANSTITPFPSNSTTQFPPNSTITPTPLPPLQNNSTANATVPQLPTVPSNNTNNDGNSGENSSLNIATIVAPIAAVTAVAVVALAAGKAIYNKMQKTKTAPTDGTRAAPQVREAWTAESALQNLDSPANSPLSASGVRLSAASLRVR